MNKVQLQPLTPDPMLDVIDECLRDGRRTSEVAAFLAREYGLDVNAIARLMSRHRAVRPRVVAPLLGLGGLVATGFALVQRHVSNHVEMVAEHAEMAPFLLMV